MAMGRMLSLCSSSCKTKRANIPAANAGTSHVAPTLQQAAISLTPECMPCVARYTSNCTAPASCNPSACACSIQTVKSDQVHPDLSPTVAKQFWHVLRRKATAYNSADDTAVR